MHEKALIELCKKLVEQKFNLPESALWKQRDFEYLSDLIFEKTAARLSISTLKRIWKDYDNRVPQTHTLNALANLLEYSSWNEFKRTNTPGGIHQKSDHAAISDQKNNVIKRNAYTLAAIFLALLLAYFGISYFWSAKSLADTGTVLFRSKKSISTGVPNTVVFEYDISKLKFDSAFIQHSWDGRMRARINIKDHFQTFIYYYPGNHTAKLIIDNQIIKKEKVTIGTDDWVGMVEDDVNSQVPYYLPHQALVSNGQLYASRQVLLENKLPVNDKKYYVDYFNVRQFNVFAHDFTFETTVKDNLDEGAFVCQYSQVTVLCENGMISLPFCHRGCESNIHLLVGEVFRDGKKNDLTAFGTDLSQWQDIMIKSEKKKITIYVMGKAIYHLSYTKDLGKVTGFHYRFYGSGSVNNVRLYDQKNELSYEDDFE